MILACKTYCAVNFVSKVNLEIVFSNRFDVLNDGSTDSSKAPKSPKSCLLSPFQLFHLQRLNDLQKLENFEQILGVEVRLLIQRHHHKAEKPFRFIRRGFYHF